MSTESGPSGTVASTLSPDQSPIRFAVDYAHQRGWGPFAKAVLLGLFSFLLVPAFVLAGYGYRLARAAATGAEQPDLTDLVGLFVDGLKLFVAILPAAFAIGLVTGVLGQVSTLLASVAYLAGLVLFPAVVLAYVASGTIAGGYDTERLSRIVRSRSYQRALIVYLVLAVVVSIVATISVVTIVGPLLIGTFAGLVFAGYWGRVYFDGVQDGEWPAVTDAGGSDDPAPEV